MADRDVDGEIDAAWTSDLKDADTSLGNGGETIESSDEHQHEGSVDTEDWPDGATDPEDLNRNQKEVIKTAVQNPDADSLREINRLADYDRNVSSGYAGGVLRNHWPAGHRRVKDEIRESEGSLSEDDVRDIRLKLLEGETTLRSLATKYNVSESTVRRAAKGERYSDVDDPAPIVHHHRDGWIPGQNSEETSDSPSAGSERDPVTASVEPPFIEPINAAESDDDGVVSDENTVTITHRQVATIVAGWALYRLLRRWF